MSLEFSVPELNSEFYGTVCGWNYANYISVCCKLVIIIDLYSYTYMTGHVVFRQKMLIFVTGYVLFTNVP